MIIRGLFIVVLVISSPPPPSGPFSKVIAQQPSFICVQVTWSEDPHEDVSLGVKCGIQKSKSDYLTVDKVAPSVYKLDDASRDEYIYFRYYVNQRCQGLLAMQDGDLATFNYDRSSQSMMVPFQGAKRNLTAGACF
ncbi:hypothetical protein FOZ63_002740 [Perkinsus olseni]|uniref:Uncharacterized protein n=1 Tax=Perkinsus olseni TaxID=32597 RepID=A0A7J6PIJ6_PEROL|nr:hypothetical protein FOZ63_002740 [Perkinsus olseni]KAF4695959.1 hypothetical protein FOZ60_002658 [Perkinsus olseni]